MLSVAGVQTVRSSAIVCRPVWSEAGKACGSVKTEGNPACPGCRVQHNRFLDVVIRYLHLNT